MRVLFDQGTPVPLRDALRGHTVETAYERGWSALKNGELIAVAEQAGFEEIETTDKNLKYQQNLANRNLAIVVLHTTSWPKIQLLLVQVVAAIDGSVKSSYAEVGAY